MFERVLNRIHLVWKVFLTSRIKVTGRREMKAIVGDKSPYVLMNREAVCEMHRIYPNAHLVHIVRDVRDTLVSCLFKKIINAANQLPQVPLAWLDTFIQNSDHFLLWSGQFLPNAPSAEWLRDRWRMWRDVFTDRDKRIFKEIAEETFIARGYEKDMEW